MTSRVPVLDSGDGNVLTGGNAANVLRVTVAYFERTPLVP
jgi:hypothetical protein